MKLNINKACDLSSISVFPPHSRTSNPIFSGVDSSGSGKIQQSQLRSQSQQPFSQGTSLSQLSQSSLDEVLTNEQRSRSQERENSGKRLSCLVPITSSRDESQMQLSRSSNNVMWRTNPASAPEQRCRVSEELENRIGLVEGSLNRLGRMLDTIQKDVMQVNKAVKEVLLEMESIRQKFIIQDNHMLLLLKKEEDAQANLSGISESILDQLRKESETADQQKLHIISAAISSLSARIEACLLKLQNEICGTFSKKVEEIGCFIVVHPKMLTGVFDLCAPVGDLKQVLIQKTEEKYIKLLEPQSFPLRNVKHTVEPKQGEILLSGQANDFCLIIDSDEEIDGGFSRLLEKKEAGQKSCSSEEARVESMRILKKARRKRKLSSAVVLD